MDRTTLVKSDLEIERLVLDALSRAKIPVTLFKWRYVPELKDTQIVIATPWLDNKGPRVTYQAIIDAFEKAGIYQDVPMRRVFVRSPHDPIVAKLEEERSEGFVHLLRHELPKEEYTVIFAPISGGGGPVPARHFSSREQLQKFLLEDLDLRPGQAADALSELDVRRSSSIFPVHLTRQQMKKLGHS